VLDLSDSVQGVSPSRLQTLELYTVLCTQAVSCCARVLGFVRHGPVSRDVADSMSVGGKVNFEMTNANLK